MWKQTLGLFLVFLSLGSYVQAEENIVHIWSQHALDMIHDTFGFLSPVGVARTLAIVDTCMWDAVAPYTTDFVPVFDAGIPRRPVAEHTQQNREIAIAFAAYRALRDIFYALPQQRTDNEVFFESFGYDIWNEEENDNTPHGIGNKACTAFLRWRHRDGLNQKGDEPGTIKRAPYSDYTNYKPSNVPQVAPGVTDCNTLLINKFQSLRVPTPAGSVSLRNYSTPQAGITKMFSDATGFDFLPPGPPQYLSNTQSYFVTNYTQVMNISATLNDHQKVVAEFWADGPSSTLPPGHWHEFALHLSMDRNLNMLQTLKLVFLQSNAVMDAGIAAWAAKRWFDNARPATAIPCLFAGQTIKSWKGPYQGSGDIPASAWVPYQDRLFVTPPFSEYVSGHSAFSAASAEVFYRFFGSDDFGFSFTVKAGESLFEPKRVAGQVGYIAGVTDVPNEGPETVGYVPREDVTLYWPTFSAAANEAGVSRLFGGIHIEAGDKDGRKLGRAVGDKVWEKYAALSAIPDDHIPDSTEPTEPEPGIPCDQSWQCTSQPYSFCDTGVCRCRFGFEGNGDVCTCPGFVAWENGIPYCLKDNQCTQSWQCTWPKPCNIAAGQIVGTCAP